MIGVENQRKNSIIRSYKEVPICGGGHGPSIRPDAWINHDDVHRSLGKITVGAFDDQRRFQNVVRMYLMRNVNNLSRGSDSKNDSLHNADEGIRKAKVGR